MRFVRLALQIALLFCLTYAYLYPGSQALFQKRADRVLSDDTDPVQLPYQYGNILKVWNEHPSRLFYGAVYYDGQDPEYGTAYWESWSERWLIVLWSKVFPVEQLSTALVFTLMILNALAMYALASYLQWNRSVASGLALAWAFSPFTRARAKVHGAMSGTFYLPLLFLGLLLAARCRSKRGLAASALCFLLAATAATYFVVNALFLSPFFLLFYALQPEVRRDWKPAVTRLAVALFPALAFLAFNFAFTIPAGTRMNYSMSIPQSGAVEEGQTHPFLQIYAARPLDYLGGDISLNGKADDPNPLKQMINSRLLKRIQTEPGSNAHEHTNGIRWTLLLLALLAVGVAAAGKTPARIPIFFFAAFAAFTLWLSLSPDVPCPRCGPSYWLQFLVPRMRVPSRSGVNVHFAVLMISGSFLALPLRGLKVFRFPLLFPLLMIASYPPLIQEMPMAEIRPAFTELQRQQGPCGTGMYFPFVSANQASDAQYNLLQRMRGSDCGILNTMTNPKRVSLLSELFPPSRAYLSRLPHDERTAMLLFRFARCVPLTWIIFDPAVPTEWREGICHKLGWQMNPSLSCVSPKKGEPLQRYPDQCF